MQAIRTIEIYVYEIKRGYRAKGDPSSTEDFMDLDCEVRDAGYLGLAPNSILGGLPCFVAENPLSAEDVEHRLYPSPRRGDEIHYGKLLIPSGTKVYVMKIRAKT